jgi:hypothetical protein
MSPIMRNILAVIAGVVIGSIVNMLIINFSGSIIAPPEGVDTTTAEGLKEGIHLFEPKHFLMPFLAHALGTLIGAYLAALIAATHKMNFAFAIGLVFLFGGIGAVLMIPAPLCYNITDLVLAYIPMAWLGGRWALKSNR